jgi:hypothetical protein
LSGERATPEGAQTVEREYRRTLGRIYEDDLWPLGGGGFVMPNPLQSIRHQAIYEVLATMPDADYEKLKTERHTFFWFIPDWRQRGEVHPFPATVYPPRRKGKGLRLAPYSKVLYLSPRLERAAWSQTLAVVAHELAHIVRVHDLHAPYERYKQQEEEAWTSVREWGFAKEEKKHEAVSKWYESWDQYIVRKIKARALLRDRRRRG